MLVVLQWHYDEREVSMMQLPQKELVAIFGMFVDKEAATIFIKTLPDREGWGKLEYEIKEFTPINQPATS